MTNDNPTLMDSINAVCTACEHDPDCLTRHDLNTLDTLKREANWLLGESCRGPMNSPRHHQAFDRIHALLRKLEKKCADYRYQKKWRDELLRQSKYNPYHKPAGSPEGGEFDFAPGGGSGSSSPGGSSPAGGNDTVGGYRVYDPSPDKLPGRDVVDRSLSKPLKVDDAVQTLRESLVNPKLGPATCARNVRVALDAGGIKVTPPPARPGADAPWARDYGLPLEAAGFQRVAESSPLRAYPPIGYIPQPGDVVVMQPTSDPKHPEGHMQMYIGKRSAGGLTDIEPPDTSSSWWSYFKQPDFWPGPRYRQDRPDYVIYRHGSQM